MSDGTPPTNEDIEDLKSILEKCGCCTDAGCTIPHDCLKVAWKNYDPALHGPDPVLAYIIKPTRKWKLQADYPSNACVWLDRDDGTATILTESGSGFLESGADTWTQDGVSVYPHYILGDYVHGTDLSGSMDVTITLSTSCGPRLTAI